jgi:LysM repeat protein
VLLIVVILLTIAGVAFFGLGGSINALRTDEPNLAAALLSRPTNTPPSRPTATASAIPTLPPTSMPLVLIPSELPTKPPTETPTITATFTPPAPTPGPEMATPFGPGNLYVLHTVQPRESLTNIAAQYSTTVEMIKALNYIMEGASVWPDRVLVIMPTIGDLNKAVQFCVFRVETPTTLGNFSQQYGVPVDEIRQYNVLGPGEELPAPRWLIFPYASMNTPSLCR